MLTGFTEIKNIKGPFKKYVTSLGGGGSSKIVTNSYRGGRGVKQNSDVIAY